MKTNKSTKILIILITMLINSISYSYNVEVKSPKACYDNFSFVYYPSNILNCKFKAYKVHPFDSDLITYKIYVVQNGNEFLLGTGDGSAEVDINFAADYQSFPEFSYNEKASIRIDVKSYDTPIVTYTGSGFFVAYREFVNSGNRVLLNGNSQLITPNPILVGFNNTCGELPTGIYHIRRTKSEFTLNGDFTDSIPELIPSLCAGFSGSGPNNQHYWGGVLFSSETQYIFYTFTYNVNNTLGQNFGNRPCNPSESAIVYKMVKRPNVAPVIVSPTAYPRTLYWNSNVCYINCNLRSGSEPVTYNWRITSNPLYSFILTPMGNRAKLKVNFNRSALREEEYHIYVSTQAVNQFGQSNWDSIKIYIRNYSTNNACPAINYIYKNDTLPENSILSESYETPNELVNGNLLFENLYIGDSKKLIFRIGETESDITELDMIGVTQVLVEKDEKVAVTREGDIVNYEVDKGKLNIVKNKTEVKTEDLETDDDKFVKLDKDDLIDVDFISDGSNFIIIRTDELVINKETPVGTITTNHGKEINVYALDNPTSFCIDVEDYSLSSFTFKAMQPVSLNQIVAAKNLNTFTENKLNFNSAIIDDNNDISKTLLYSDNKAVKISKGNYIDFCFDGKLTDINKRSYYICNSRGRINTVIKNSGNEKISKEKHFTNNKLSDNLPNPFNPVTKINYQIAKDGFVKLNVFDIAGREVKTIVNEFKTAGSYEVVFDGSGISSGTYFYRIETSNGFKDTKRMILIK